MKYELVTTDKKHCNGKTLYRIRARRALDGLIPAGELGGYIEDVKNLSQTGNAWVSGDAQVSGNARVYGDARVSGNARVYGTAWVYDNAQVSGNARVCGNAQVSGNARVCGNAQVSGNAHVHGDAQVCGDALISDRTEWLLVGPSKSSGRFTTAYADSKIGVRVSCGCFTGTVQEFSRAIEETHKDNKENLEQYRLFCQLIAFNFNVQP